jgi:16S rRNA processing protein RimM
LADKDDQRICLGAVAGVHGVKGLVRLKSFTADPKDIASYGPLEDERGARRFEIAVTGASRGALIARIQGIEDRNAAERLKGEKLYVKRSCLPPTNPEEFYQHDLVGLEARLEDGSRLGRVEAVFDFGGGANLEIALAEGHSVMVPFTRRTVPKVDLSGGLLTVAPPEGLLEQPKPKTRRA